MARQLLRRTQEMRSEEMRTRLLEATIDCLVELGWAGTTTTEIAKRAGVSRGAQQHHFPTKADLVETVAMYLTRQSQQDLRHAAAKLSPGPFRVRQAIDVLWDVLSDRRATAYGELWLVAKSDPELYATLYETERSYTRETFDLLRTLFAGETCDHEEDLNLLVDVTAHFLRGLAFRRQTSGNSRRIGRNIEAWKRITELIVKRIEAGSPILTSKSVLDRAGADAP